MTGNEQHRPLERPASLIVAVAATMTMLLFVAMASSEENYLYVIVMLMFIACFGPAWFAWHRGRIDFFEPVHVIGLIYFVFFGLGAILVVNDPRIAYDKHLVPYVPRAAFYCLIGYVCFLTGYYGPRWRHSKGQEWEEVPVGGISFLGVPVLIGAAGALGAAEKWRAHFQGQSFSVALNLLAQLVPLFLFAWALGWLLILSRTATRAHKIAFYGLLLPVALVVIATLINDKSVGLTMIGVPLIALWYSRGKLPWKTLLLLLVFVILVVFPLVNTFRGYDPALSFGVRASLTAETVKRWDAQDYQRVSTLTAKKRFAMINSVAVVVRDVPRWVPYEKGKQLLLGPMIIVVPRFVWPDKPTVTLGREFGETFRVVHILDERTAIGATVPGELYWNFDLPGIMVGMLLWGLFAKWVYRRYGSSLALDPVGKAILIVLLIEFAHLGGGLVAGIGGIVKTLAVLAAYRWLARRSGLLERRPANERGRVKDSRPAGIHHANVEYNS